MPYFETEKFMTYKGKANSCPKNIFIFDFIVLLISSRPRMHICWNISFMSYKSKEDAIGHGITEGAKRSKITLPLTVIVKYLTSSLNISTPACYVSSSVLFLSKSVIFQTLQLSSFNLELNWLAFRLLLPSRLSDLPNRLINTVSFQPSALREKNAGVRGYCWQLGSKNCFSSSVPEYGKQYSFPSHTPPVTRKPVRIPPPAEPR